MPERTATAQTRVATQADIDTVFEILSTAFKMEGKPEKLEITRKLVEQKFAEFLLLEDGNQIVAALHAARHVLQVGTAQIFKADVGHVAVRPEFHRKGYGTALMQASTVFLKEHGFHIARLGGLMRFYSRFGYEPFPRRVLRIQVEPMDEVFKGRKRSEILALPPELTEGIRAYRPATDYAAKHALKRAWNLNRSGAVPLAQTVLPGTGPEPGKNTLEFIYEKDGKLRGYLKGDFAKIHTHAPEPTYCINELVYDTNCPEACEALLKTFIFRAAEIAPTTITARLPFDETLFADINRADIAFEVVEMRQAADGNMMKIIDLIALLKAISPELRHRLEACGVRTLRGRFRFVLPDGEAGLLVSRGTLRIGPPGDDAIPVRTDQSTFLKWVFGIAGFAEFALSDGIAAEERLLLNILFPRCPCATGMWG